MHFFSLSCPVLPQVKQASAVATALDKIIQCRCTNLAKLYNPPHVATVHIPLYTVYTEGSIICTLVTENRLKSSCLALHCTCPSAQARSHSVYFRTQKLWNLVQISVLWQTPPLCIILFYTELSILPCVSKESADYYLTRSMQCTMGWAFTWEIIKKNIYFV